MSQASVLTCVIFPANNKMFEECIAHVPITLW